MRNVEITDGKDTTSDSCQMGKLQYLDPGAELPTLLRESGSTNARARGRYWRRENKGRAQLDSPDSLLDVSSPRHFLEAARMGEEEALKHWVRGQSVGSGLHHSITHSLSPARRLCLPPPPPPARTWRTCNLSSVRNTTGWTGCAD